MEGKRNRSWAVIRHPYFRYHGPSWARSLGMYFFWCRGRKADIHYINLLMQRRRKYAKTVALVKKSNAPSAQVLVTFSNCPSTCHGSVHLSIHLSVPTVGSLHIYVCVCARDYACDYRCMLASLQSQSGRVGAAVSERQSPLRPF